MRKVFLQMVVLTLIGCANSSNDKLSDDDIYYNSEQNFYYKEVIPIDPKYPDSIYIYSDSNGKILKAIQTKILVEGKKYSNQLVFINNDTIETTIGYHFSVKNENGKLQFKINSELTDSIYLIIGDIDVDYRKFLKTDTFLVEGNEISINKKEFYKRAILGLYNRTDSGTYIGKDLYVPNSYLNNKNEL